MSDLQENGIEESESTLETSLSPNGQKNSKKMPKSSKTNKSKKAESTVKSKTSAMNSSLPSSEQGAATVAGGEVIQGTVAQSHSGEKCFGIIAAADLFGGSSTFYTGTSQKYNSTDQSE